MLNQLNSPPQTPPYPSPPSAILHLRLPRHNPRLHSLPTHESKEKHTVFTIICSCELIPAVSPCMPARPRPGIPATLISADCLPSEHAVCSHSHRGLRLSGRRRARFEGEAQICEGHPRVRREGVSAGLPMNTAVWRTPFLVMREEGSGMATPGPVRWFFALELLVGSCR